MSIEYAVFQKLADEFTSTYGRPDETAAWTTAVKAGLRAAKSDLANAFDVPLAQMTCFHNDPRVGADERHEYLVDFCWTTWPTDYDSLARPHRYQVLLAAESEWGEPGSVAKHRDMVLDDFCKLVDIRARMKVLVYGLRASAPLHDEFEVILKNAERDDREHWLFVGLPEMPRAGRWPHYVRVVRRDGSLIRPNWQMADPRMVLA